ncbi:MAG: hypothetical protein QW594_00740 [Candidatus Woesearchaeota archaeon]
MQTKLTFLGTGGDIFVMAKQSFSTGGILFQHADTLFHLDPGPGALCNLRRAGYNPRAVLALLISHPHVLRSGDMQAMIAAMTYDGFDKRGMLIAAPSVAVPTPNPLEKTVFLAPYEGVTELEVSGIHIKALPTFGNTGIGFRITTAQGILVYSGDTFFHKTLLEAYQGAHYLVLSVPSFEPTNQGLTRDDAISIIETIRPKVAIITGFGIKTLQHDILFEMRTIQKYTGCQTIAARDMQSITLS